MRQLQWQSQQPIRGQRPKDPKAGGTAGFAPKCVALWMPDAHRAQSGYRLRLRRLYISVQCAIPASSSEPARRHRPAWPNGPVAWLLAAALQLQQLLGGPSHWVDLCARASVTSTAAGVLLPTAAASLLVRALQLQLLALCETPALLAPLTAWRLRSGPLLGNLRSACCTHFAHIHFSLLTPVAFIFATMHLSWSW
jgi:hypothetical protein